MSSRIDDRRSLFAKLQAQVAAATPPDDEPVVLTHERSRRPWVHGEVTIRLCRVDLVDESHIGAGTWRTRLTLYAGEVKDLSAEREVTDSIVLAPEAIATLRSEIGLDPKQAVALKADLHTALRARYAETEGAAVKVTMSGRRRYELADRPTDSNELHVWVRRIQRAPVYRRLRAELVSECSACHARGAVAIDVCLATGAWATRREDHLSDGSVRLYDLGTD
jgi:hypothetical protein